MVRWRVDGEQYGYEEFLLRIFLPVSDCRSLKFKIIILISPKRRLVYVERASLLKGLEFPSCLNLLIAYSPVHYDERLFIDRSLVFTLIIDFCLDLINYSATVRAL